MIREVSHVHHMYVQNKLLNTFGYKTRKIQSNCFTTVLLIQVNENQMSVISCIISPVRLVAYAFHVMYTATPLLSATFEPSHEKTIKLGCTSCRRGVLSTLYYWVWGVLSAFKKNMWWFCPRITKWTWGVMSVGCFVRIPCFHNA